MMSTQKLSALIIALLIPLSAQAQTSPTEHQKLAFLLPELVEERLQRLDSGLRQLLRPAFSPSFAAINTGLAADLSNRPIPSPASAVRYVFDRQLGVRV